jgi:enterochelin esterase-like enzyme
MINNTHAAHGALAITTRGDITKAEVENVLRADKPECFGKFHPTGRDPTYQGVFCFRKGVVMTRFHSQKIIFAVFAVVLALLAHTNVFAQAKFKAPPAIKSPEVLPDGRILFRILAPKADSIGLQASDIAGFDRGGPQFVKGENGIWETTVGPIAPGAYRYVFTVNDVSVMDPQNPAVSEANSNAWSLVYVPGAEFMDTLKVPHGAVAAVHYYSTALGRHRRMHIYTPPGYESGNLKYPVFYLLHGAMDCDDSWTSVGRAGFILDNLIAAKKAKPMIVVMPAGHTSSGFSMGAGLGATMDEFGQDFVKDLMPYVEANYRVLKDRGNRALAGLSMGGMQTLNISMSDLGKFSYIGVFSSGVFGGAPKKAAAGDSIPAAPAPSADWEQQHLATLDNADLKKDLKLLWFATGAEDFLLNTTRSTLDIFKKHGFSPVYKETSGGHTWINWRNYLNEFAPLLFQ